jgi:SAM-dependent methyltransferase
MTGPTALRNGLLALIPDRRQNLVRRLIRPAPRGLLLRRGPVSRRWGFDRGLPIDRYFIESFLERSRADIRGRVLEVKDDGYTRRFGSAVTSAEVLDIDPTNTAATIIADLTDAPDIPDDSYDCVLLTQVLHWVYDIQSAVKECRRILKPGGTLLVTMPSLSRCREQLDGDFWRLMPAGAGRLFGDVFGPQNVTVAGHGNAVLGAAFFIGVATEEVSSRQLDRHDPYFPILVTIRAIKAP